MRSLRYVAMSVVALAMLLQSPLLFTSRASAQELPPVVSARSSISVKVDDVKFHELYNFTTDLHNDTLWFPDVAETIVINEAPVNTAPVGRVYLQRSYFAGFPLDTRVEVVDNVGQRYYEINGVGMFATYNAKYHFDPVKGGKGGIFTLETVFTAPGITEEGLTYLLTTAMQNILDYYGSEGEITMNYFEIL